MKKLFAQQYYRTNIVIVCQITKHFEHFFIMAKTKAEIRRNAKTAVKSLSADQKKSKSALIFKSIVHLDSIKSAKSVALYASLPDEVYSFDAIEEWSQTKRVFLPRVAGDDMDFYPYVPGTLSSGAFGISEPQVGQAVEASEIDVIVVPGVAFTILGERLGRGKGYYDRYMSRPGFRATKVGVCYAEQLADDIPTEPHDIAMDYVIFD